MSTIKFLHQKNNVHTWCESYKSINSRKGIILNNYIIYMPLRHACFHHVPPNILPYSNMIFSLAILNNNLQKANFTLINKDHISTSILERGMTSRN